MSNIEKRKLPTIQELYTDKIELSKQNDLNLLLNQPPKSEWVKEHPFIKKTIEVNGEKKKVPLKYIPIERVEWLMYNIFVKWKSEILREGVIANSVFNTVRVHYRDPITGEWDWIDGTAAVPLQVDEKAAATDWTKIKSGAVMMGLPSAESYAIKDAVEKLGKLFGRDLNRDAIDYDTLQGKFIDPESAFELQATLATYTNSEELKKNKDGIVEKFVAKGLKKSFVEAEIVKQNEKIRGGK